MEATEGSGVARPVVQRVSVERIGVPRLRSRRVGDLPPMRFDRPRPLPAVVLHQPVGKAASRSRDRDEPSPRRRVPQLHAALVLVSHERFRPQRAPRRHPARPAGDRPARRLGRRRAHAPRARARPRHRPRTCRAVPCDRTRRADVPPGAVAARRHRSADDARVPRRQHARVLELRLGSHRPPASRGIHVDGAGHQRVRSGVARRTRPPRCARRHLPDRLARRSRPDQRPHHGRRRRGSPPHGLRTVLPVRNVGVPSGRSAAPSATPVIPFALQNRWDGSPKSVRKRNVVGGLDRSPSLRCRTCGAGHHNRNTNMVVSGRAPGGECTS